ncbi:MFS transporter [Streptomyces uncialis]|uniref:MFS transporter n=1 Tax=Streptomyces uncialis TaxID=1048205 RepID=UPI0037F4A588
MPRPLPEPVPRSRALGAAAPGRRPSGALGGVLAATAVSLTGTRISAIALPWFVLGTTGSATRAGLVAFAEMTPYVLVKAFTGPLVDRAGPRTVSWTTDLVSAAAAMAVPVLHFLDTLPLWLLLALVAVIGAARGPGDLAKEVLVPEAAEHGAVPLERASGLAGVTERLASTLGPAAGGALVAVAGPMAGLAVNAVCFAAGSLIITVTLPRGMGRGTAPPGEDPGAGSGAGSATGSGAGSGAERRTGCGSGQGVEAGYWRRLGEGFAFLRGDRLLLALSGMIAVTNLLASGFITVLLPVWAKESGNGPATIGLLAATGGVAAIGAGLIASAVAHRMRRRPVFFLGFLCAGAPRFVVLASGAPMWVVLAVFVIDGFGSGFLNPILGAIRYERVPRPLLGRVSALVDSLAWAGIPLGGLIAGAAVTVFGLVPALLAGGAAYFLTTTLTGLRPEWREMDRSRGRTGGSPEPEEPPGGATRVRGEAPGSGPAGHP